MVKSIAELTFGGDFDPEQFRQLVAGLGGERDDVYWDVVMQRGDSVVWIDILPAVPGRMSHFDVVERLLGSEPCYRVMLHGSSNGASEWLIAEVVVAASEKWKLVLLGFDEQPITMAELDKRIARRTEGLLWSRRGR
ncbi:hypothetical protein [Nocardia sp. CS682]|uniref:hypothetical protein n=1 Tax=Nocardia sp. CS682 TaxID=1047172 RepID=UPI0014311454|nr:hypothetical protein [Nocardia sp. CS682]